MSEQQLATTQPRASALVALATRFQSDPARLLETLKTTVFRDARSNEELQALCIVANTYGLNPFTKEIYAFPAKGGGIVPVVSVDGWTSMMNNHPQMDGIEFEDKHDAAGALVSITAIIHRKDRTRPIKVTEYLSECKRNTDPWKMEHRMLRHKALTQCARIAFGFSGIHDDDEGDVIREVKATEIPKAQMSTTTTAVEAEVLPAETKPEPERPKATRKPREAAPTPPPEAEPAPAPDETKPEPPPAAEKKTTKTDLETLADKLAEANFSQDTCLKMATAMLLCPKGTSKLEGIPARNVTAILEDWETAVATMNQIDGK